MSTPTLYTPELAERILQELRCGRTLLDLCTDQGMPAERTVINWVATDREGFAARYRQARQAGDAALGRPSVYSREVGERILAQLTSGRTLADLAQDPGMPPYGTIRQWVLEDREGFTAHYKLAQEIGRVVSGRGLPYSEVLAERILGELMEGRVLIDVCDDPGMPSKGTVLRWVQHDREGFRERYQEARDIGNRLMADEITVIGDDGRNDYMARRAKDGGTEIVFNQEHVSRSRLRCANRRWLLSKLLPKIYGDRVDVNADAKRDAGDGWAKLMNAVKNKTRGLPKKKDGEGQ